MSYKVYNQIKVNPEIFSFLKQIREGEDAKKTNIRLFAEDYDGIKWTGSWSIPTVNLFETPYLLVHGEFDQLATRADKIEGDQEKNSTELVFAGNLNLPFAGTVNVKRFHGDKVISTSLWGDHHDVIFGDSSILIQESADKERTHVTASHSDQFTAPYVENWITEALIFITARMLYPRMVIRHFEKDALIFIRATPQNTVSGMPPPFSSTLENRESTWGAFCAYLSKCKSYQQFDFLEITKGLCELILASKGSLQGFLVSLALYVEFCANNISSSAIDKICAEEDEYRKKVDDFLQHVDTWQGDDVIKERANGLLSMLHTPSLTNRIDALIERGVITETHKKIWKKARPYLAHGNVVDFSKEEEFWHFRNYLISMVYRLILRIIGYKGIVLDYDGSEFRFVQYEWY